MFVYENMVCTGISIDEMSFVTHIGLGENLFEVECREHITLFENTQKNGLLIFSRNTPHKINKHSKERSFRAKSSMNERGMLYMGSKQ